MKYVWLLILAGLGACLISGWHRVDLSEPACGRFTTDEKIYLKTYYLVKQGIPYHKALYQATDCEAGTITLGQDVFTWRPGAIFYLWSVIAVNGDLIKWWFWLLVLLAAYCWVTILKPPLIPALLGVALAIPYFAEHLAYPTGFLLTEWWGLLFFSFALLFLVKKHYSISFGLMVAAVMVRELLIIPLLVLGLALFRKKQYVPLIVGGLILVGYYAYHIVSIRSIVGSSGEFTGLSRFHLPDKLSLLRMSAYFTQRYPGLTWHSVKLLWFIGFLELGWEWLRGRQPEIKIKAAMLLSLIMILPFMVTGFWTDYWGILLLPLTLIHAPLGISRGVRLR